MAFQYLQEITILTSKPSRFTAYIANTEGEAIYEAWLCLEEDRELSGVGIKPKHESPEIAFNEIVASIGKYSENYDTEITSIDNPCNSPFITIESQEEILQRNGIKVKPKLNGV